MERETGVAVVGLGRLGLPLSCVLASRGCRVIGIDRTAAVVDAVNAGEYCGSEPRVAELLADTRARDALRASQSLDDLSETSIAFVVVGTPSRDGTFSLEEVLPAVSAVARSVPPDRPYVIALVSTVMPGDCEGRILSAIRAVRRPNGCEISLVYAPEYVALGSVVDQMTAPQYIILGSDDARAAARVERLLQSDVQPHSPVLEMSFVNAEIAKIALNVAVAMKITLGNVLGQVCGRIPGGDSDVVASALLADRRIGERCLHSGLRFGGPCFSRDVRSLQTLLGRLELGDAAAMMNQVSRFNDWIPAEVVSQVRRLSPRGTVGVLGLVYRPGSGSVAGSQALEIVGRLVEAGHEVLVYDPEISSGDPVFEALSVVCVESVHACIRRADCVVIATQDPCFSAVDSRLWAGKAVVDCWRLLDPGVMSRAEDVRYVALGRLAPDSVRTSREEI